MDGLAPGQHVHGGGDAPRPGLGPPGGVEPVEDGITVLAAEAIEHRPRPGVRLQRLDQVGRHLDGGQAGVGGRPPAVGPGLLDGGQPGGVRAAAFDQALGQADVATGPGTLPRPGREAAADRWPRRAVAPARRSSRGRAPRPEPDRRSGWSAGRCPSWPGPAVRRWSPGGGQPASAASRSRRRRSARAAQSPRNQAPKKGSATASRPSRSTTSSFCRRGWRALRTELPLASPAERAKAAE